MIRCIYRCAETAIGGVLWKKVFLKISQNSQGNTCVGVSFFNKVAGLSLVTLLKKRLQHRCFPMNLAKFLRTPFSQNAFGRLLLDVWKFNIDNLKVSFLLIRLWRSQIWRWTLRQVSFNNLEDFFIHFIKWIADNLKVTSNTFLLFCFLIVRKIILKLGKMFFFISFEILTF